MEPMIEVAKFDLTLFGHEVERCFEFTVEYCSRLFLRETMERLCEHFVVLVHSVLEDADASLADLEMLSMREHQQTRHSTSSLRSRWKRLQMQQHLCSMTKH